MTSRDKILTAVKNAQPPLVAAPELPVFRPFFHGTLEKFADVLQGIGGTLDRLNARTELSAYLKKQFPDATRIVSPIPECSGFAQPVLPGDDPHLLENVDVAIVPAQFGVAENGAVWITEAQLGARVLPFIGQHLVVILSENDLVDTMHQAYARIGAADYGFGVFIAGPSKTADIEQSLVLGAHGARSMTVLLIHG